MDAQLGEEDAQFLLHSAAAAEAFESRMRSLVEQGVPVTPAGLVRPASAGSLRSTQAFECSPRPLRSSVAAPLVLSPYLAPKYPTRPSISPKKELRRHSAKDMKGVAQHTHDGAAAAARSTGTWITRLTVGVPHPPADSSDSRGFAHAFDAAVREKPKASVRRSGTTETFNAPQCATNAAPTRKRPPASVGERQRNPATQLSTDKLAESLDRLSVFRKAEAWKLELNASTETDSKKKVVAHIDANSSLLRAQQRTISMSERARKATSIATPRSRPEVDDIQVHAKRRAIMAGPQLVVLLSRVQAKMRGWLSRNLQGKERLLAARMAKAKFILTAWARRFQLRQQIWLAYNQASTISVEVHLRLDECVRVSLALKRVVTVQRAMSFRGALTSSKAAKRLSNALGQSKSAKPMAGSLTEYAGLTGIHASVKRGATRLRMLNELPPTMHRKYKESTGRSLRVFLSSTFRDMNEEREIFTKRYAAALRQVAKERGVSISFVDLRWGVTVEQATGGGVVDICLTNLQGSRYFVNFLGLRYPALSPN